MDQPKSRCLSHTKLILMVNGPILERQNMNSSAKCYVFFPAFNRVKMSEPTPSDFIFRKLSGADPVDEWSSRWATMPAIAGLIPHWRVWVLMVGQCMSAL